MKLSVEKLRDDIFDRIDNELEEWDTSDEMDRGARKALRNLKKIIEQFYGVKGSEMEYESESYRV